MHKRHLHIGSGIPHWKLAMSSPGEKHMLVDPKFKTDKKSKKFVEQEYPDATVHAMGSHTYLDKEISSKEKFDVVHLDMPRVGIIDKGSDFPGLAKKIKKVLRKDGRVVLLIDRKPDSPGVTLEGATPKLHSKLNGLVGRPKEKELILKGIKNGDFIRHDTVNITEELRKAGFKIKVNPASSDAIENSVSAVRIRDRDSKMKFYQIVATH